MRHISANENTCDFVPDSCPGSRILQPDRDYSSASSDFFGFILDTFNDRENAVSFHTNPNGLRTDGTVKNDALDLNDVSFSWNTFWDVGTAFPSQATVPTGRYSFAYLSALSAIFTTEAGMFYDGLKFTIEANPMVKIGNGLDLGLTYRKVISNVRFRYNPGEGNDFYIVYDETQNTRLTREFPMLPHTDNRTILLKYTYTFRW